MRIKMIYLRRTYEFVFFCVYAIIQKKSVYRQSMDKKTLGGFCFSDVLYACHQRLLCCHGFFEYRKPILRGAIDVIAI